jgi:AraC-like DNA-binding protein
MAQDTFHLPEAFTNGLATDCFIYYYTADQNSTKNKIIYNQNLIGFLQHGMKEVYSSQNHAIIDDKNILMLNSGSVLMSQNIANHDTFDSILLFFSNKFVSNFSLKYHAEITRSRSLDIAANLFTIPKDTFLQNFEASLLLIKQIDSDKLQEIKTEELLIYLLRQYPKQTSLFLSNTLHKSPYTKIQEVVHANIDKDLTIEELAFLCNMSISTFKRHFIANYKMSPKKYFLKYRMMQAKQYLQMNNRASEIYNKLGYESLSAFSNEFKKYFGLSPKQFQSKNELLDKQFDLSD